MPSYTIGTSASLAPKKVADFALGIAEQWLKSARDGGGIKTPMEGIQPHVETALAACAQARTLLREPPEVVTPITRKQEGSTP